jgi:transcription initiation factor IIE alpha subunit
VNDIRERCPSCKEVLRYFERATERQTLPAVLQDIADHLDNAAVASFKHIESSLSLAPSWHPLRQ